MRRSLMWIALAPAMMLAACGDSESSKPPQGVEETMPTNSKKDAGPRDAGAKDDDQEDASTSKPSEDKPRDAGNAKPDDNGDKDNKGDSPSSMKDAGPKSDGPKTMVDAGATKPDDKDDDAGMGPGGNPEPGEKGSCCAAHDSAGCSNADLEVCVCEVRQSCCKEKWDEECTKLVKAKHCQPGVRECVCGDGEGKWSQHSCCDEAWTENFCNQVAFNKCGAAMGCL